jgi:hypothetical protein
MRHYNSPTQDGMRKDSANSAIAPSALPEAEGSAIREQLERITASAAFRSSRRYPEFLRYTVAHALTGEIENLKERVLGVEVFGRDPDYDTSSDPVVRMTAGEVRKRLEQYYHIRGHENEIRIDLPRGSYVPEFAWPLPARAAPVEGRHAEPVAAPARSVRRHGRLRIAAYAAVACVIAAAAYWGSASTRKSALERFWAPVYDSQSPVLLCIPDIATITLSEPANPNPDPNFPWTTIARMPKGWQRDEVSFVDAFTVMKVASSLTQKHRTFRLMHTEDATLDDLKQGPAVLIGGTNNPWINQVSSELRFALAHDGPLEYISDRQNPASRQWGITWNNPGVDYAIVSRIFNATTGQPVVIAAGVHRTGTEAAGECFSDANCFEQAEKLAPGDWLHANLQFILETKVINDVPGQPQVIAAYLLH